MEKHQQVQHSKF